ncbi:hypothetical protein [Streptomyces sp. V4I8]|uniref:hypothetical protein n=1 Tax=Streptomyces sp. V4I8 TaxID=3156469 RepID=UPI0035116A2D
MATSRRTHAAMTHPLIKRAADAAARIDAMRKRHAEEEAEALAAFDQISYEVLTRDDMPAGASAALSVATGRNAKGLYLARDRAAARLAERNAEKADEEHAGNADTIPGQTAPIVPA